MNHSDLVDPLLSRSSLGDPNFSWSELLSGRINYQGHHFIGHVPIWVRPPTGSERCPWTARKRQNFRDVVHELRDHLILYKLNPETEAGSMLVWLPSLMEALKPSKSSMLQVYGCDDSFRRIFPQAPDVYIRPPRRGEVCPWTSLSETSFRNVVTRQFGKSKRTQVTAVPLPDLLGRMIADSEVPEWFAMMAKRMG